jgi:hypothetical protein
MTTLCTTTIASMKQWLEANPIQGFIDNRYPLSETYRTSILTDGFACFEDLFFENNLHSDFEYRSEHFITLVGEHQGMIEEDLGLFKEDQQKLATHLLENVENMEELRNDIEVTWDILSMLDNETANVRLTLFSNHDGILSNHSVEYYQSGYAYDDYLKQVIDLLNLNPQTVKKSFQQHNILVRGEWPNFYWRNSKEFINYEDFAVEAAHRTCWSLYAIVGTIPLRSLTEHNLETLTEITIPKGNNTGYFSHMEGGGSLMETELKRDFTINLNDPFRLKSQKTKYDYLQLMSDSNHGYSLHEVYGVCQSFWGRSIKLTA